MVLNLTSFDAALKQHYKPQKISSLVYPDNPLLAMLPKYEKFGGRNMPVIVKRGNPQGRSATFATAQTNVGNTGLEDFLLTRVSDYGVARVDNETLEASVGDKNAFVQAVTLEIDSMIEEVARSLAIQLYGTGGGSRGQIASTQTLSSAVITLEDAEDITNFEVGQVLVASTAESSTTVKQTSSVDNTYTIISIDRSAGTMSGSTNGGAPGLDGFTSNDWAASDFLFQQGDADAMVTGLRGWLPATAPSAGDAFFGVDRSVDASRLAGQRFDGSALPIEEALIEGASLAAREGGKPDTCFMAYGKWADLEKALGSKVQYIDLPGPGSIGFRGIVVYGPRGPINVVPDQNCPSTRAFMLDIKSFALNSIGAAPKILMSDGNRMLRVSDADQVEVRVGYYAQLGCNAPGHNVNINLG